MKDKTNILVEGADGLRGSANSIPASGAAEVLLEGGQVVHVPVEMLSRRNDGSYSMPLRRSDLEQQPGSGGQAPEIAIGQFVIPVVHERVRFEKEVVETGKVSVHVIPNMRTEVVDVPLSMERVEIDRVASDRIVDRAEPPREEGDVTIVPVYEEVLVIERKLRLKEEVRIRRIKSVHHERHEVELRGENVEVVRSEGKTNPSSGPKASGIRESPSEAREEAGEKQKTANTAQALREGQAHRKRRGDATPGKY